MQVKTLLIPVFLCTLLSCSFKKHQESKNFYNTIAGWDIRYIPVIKPIKVSSIDKGENWLLNMSEWRGGEYIYSLGVSQNLVYGQTSGNCDRCKSEWFLFDINSKLFARYDTKDELLSALTSFNISVNPIASCNDYFDSLEKGKRCYWYSKSGEKYPKYEALKPRDVKTIKVYKDEVKQYDFQIAEELKKEESGIYFFQVRFNESDSDLLYLSFNNSQPVKTQDGLTTPVFNQTNQFQVTLYTPYPIAEQKGIPKDKRIYIKKTFALAE